MPKNNLTRFLKHEICSESQWSLIKLPTDRFRSRPTCPTKGNDTNIIPIKNIVIAIYKSFRSQAIHFQSLLHTALPVRIPLRSPYISCHSTVKLLKELKYYYRA